MSSLIEHIMLLKRVPFFEGLRTDQLRYVATALEPIEWLPGNRVFDMGEPGEEMYIIVSGRIGISILSDPNSKEFVAEIKDGDCFGEMGILDDLPRSATAHVLEHTAALALAKERLRGLLASYPEIGIGMLRAMSRRLRTANAMLAQARAEQK